MCGFIALAGVGAEPKLVEAGLRTLSHRGPDAVGTWHSPCKSVALGHARLSILDLSGAATQPMLSRDGGSAIAYNGELYNFRELSPQVGPLRTRSDTEVLLELLRARGPAALQALRGMFGFAFWDGTELLVARDRVGIKPVFYATSTHGGLAVASEIGSLLAMGRGERRPDLDAVDDYLTYLYVPPPRTGVAGVKELPPGHMLRWRPDGRATVERYWSLPTNTPAPVDSHELRTLIEDAVRMHLVSDVPVGVFLSGGLDSSAIVAMAARHHPGQLKTFTVTFGDEGRHLDERRFADEVVRRYATMHTEIPVRADVARILPSMVRHFGQPFGNPTAILTFALSEATRRHVKVALAGDGGDELLGGYPRYQGVWLSETYRRLPKPVRATFSRLVERTVMGSARGRLGSRAHRFASSAEASAEDTYFRWVTYLDGAAKDQLFLPGARPNLGADAWGFLRGIRRGAEERTMRDAAALVDLQSFLPCNVLAYGDRMSMAHALEVRVPFCDHVLLERIGPLPLHLKMPAGVQKGLMRWALRHDLPLRVSTHRKVGFNPPMAEWLANDLSQFLEDHLGTPTTARRGLFRPESVRAMVGAFRSGDRSNALTLWALVVLEEWWRWLEGLRPCNGI